MTHPVAAGEPLTLRLLSAPTFWRCEPSWSWASRPLPDHLLWCVLDGRGRLELDGEEQDLHPGICAVFAPGDAPTASHDPRRRLLVFGMHFDVEESNPERSGPERSAVERSGAERSAVEGSGVEGSGVEGSGVGGPGAGVVPAPRWGEVMDRELLGVLARTSDASYRRQDALGRRQAELCLEQLLGMIWDAVYNPGRNATDGAVDEVARLIRQDPGHDWTVGEMARRAALSRAQFTRRFVAQLGMSPAQYLIQSRIDRAHQLLTETGMTVTQTAAALGYTDVPYFSRQYKQRTGRTPSQDR
ncbi:AraC-like DNA-binding protein [Kribbella antiqua]|uniref:AraC-like DNA-binding protein n=1 Tax=Kribbella antiqua TaxID=2512217 RepID=A0A4R2IVA1_9ACTN|nr:AraC family transcriptional regulator [Kribbella antiqua]TCO48602.1 AraC-like DNA-binding protein [Kribbella antiqua]